MDGKLLSGIKSMYVDSSASVRIKVGESERFWIHSGVRQGCIMSPWQFNVYMNGVMNEVKIEMGRKGMRFVEDGGEWRLLVLLYADDLFLCNESEEDLGAMVGRFVEECRRGLKVNTS